MRLNRNNHFGKKVECITDGIIYNDVWDAINSTGSRMGIYRLHEACVGINSTFKNKQWKYVE